MDDNGYLERLAADSIAIDKIEHLEGKVAAWISQAYGEFKIYEIIKDLGIRTEDDISELKFALHGLCVVGKIKENKRKNGTYTKIDISLEKMKRVEDRTPPIDLWLPFGLHDKVVVIRGSLIIVAGVGNAGKSTFCLNFTEKNMDKYRIRYISSEWTNEERDIQLEDFGANIDEWDEKVDFFAKKDVTSSFDNYIDPEKINIIDYYEKYDNYGEIPGDLRAIADKLTSGIAIVAMQKKTGMTHGYGGEGTVNRAQLYVNLDINELDPRKRMATIRKLKKAKDRKYSIERLSCEFEYDHKGRIVEQSDWGKIIEMKQKGVLMEKYIQAEHWANQKIEKKDNFEWE